MRLKGYDYSTPGFYYVTVCVEGRECLLGNIGEDSAVLTDVGQMVERRWLYLPDRFPMVQLDAYVVMPNHFHGVINILPIAGSQDELNVGAGPCARPRPRIPGPPHGAAPTTALQASVALPDVMRWFKTMTTNEHIRSVKTHGWPAFRGRLWQRGYYERVIRNDAELAQIREYIVTNPSRWALDVENQSVPSSQSAKEPWEV